MGFFRSVTASPDDLAGAHDVGSEEVLVAQPVIDQCRHMADTIRLLCEAREGLLAQAQKRLTGIS